MLYEPTLCAVLAQMSYQRRPDPAVHRFFYRSRPCSEKSVRSFSRLLQLVAYFKTSTGKKSESHLVQAGNALTLFGRKNKSHLNTGLCRMDRI